MNKVMISNLSINNYHAQKTIDFYYNVLGFELINKKIINNLYQLTFLVNETTKTTLEINSNYNDKLFSSFNLISEITFKINQNDIDYFKDTLIKYKINFNTKIKFNEQIITFNDPSGITINLETNLTADSIDLYGINLNILNIDDTINFFNDFFNLKIDNEQRRIYFNNSQFIELNEFDIDPLLLSNQMINYFTIRLNQNFIDLKDKLISNNFYILNEFKEKDYENFQILDNNNLIISFENNFKINYSTVIDDNYSNDIYPVVVKKMDKLINYPYQNKLEYRNWKDHQDLLSEINHLARKSKDQGLTDDEVNRQQLLRKKYVKNITQTLKRNIDNIEYEDKDGKYKKITKKERSI